MDNKYTDRQLKAVDSSIIYNGKTQKFYDVCPDSKKNNKYNHDFQYSPFYETRNQTCVFLRLIKSDNKLFFDVHRSF
jgi:hypothetical protein